MNVREHAAETEVCVSGVQLTVINGRPYLSNRNVNKVSS